MNQEKFEATLRELTGRTSVDLRFVTSWFERTLDQLSSLKEQRRTVEHIRDRGDARESDFTDILGRILPKSVAFLRGYGINEYATRSREQDCLLLDKNRAAALISTTSTAYYPIEAILGAIEIKSKLDLSELRKLIVSCVSLKKLAYSQGLSEKNYTEEPKVRLAYFVFAYGSVWGLKETCARINTLVKAVPYTLRPNMFYILKQGFLLPHNSPGFRTGPDQLFATTEFGFQGKIGTKYLPKSDAMPFLWFLSNIIDHCLREIDQRKSPWYGKYVFAPQIVQSVMEQRLAKDRPNGKT